MLILGTLHDEEVSERTELPRTYLDVISLQRKAKKRRMLDAWTPKVWTELKQNYTNKQRNRVIFETESTTRRTGQEPRKAAIITQQ